MENTEIKQEQTPQVETPVEEKSVENKPQPKVQTLDNETKNLLEAENNKLKAALSDLHYKNAGFDAEHREWVQTILEKEGKHLYDEKINDVLADKKYDIFRKAENDTHTQHVNNTSVEAKEQQDGKPKQFTEEELDNISIYIPARHGKK